MKLLFTGRGTSGSWQIRGEQLGKAVGAKVKQGVGLYDCSIADKIVVVKRINADSLKAIRDSGKPWAYDILDAYPQPGCSEWDRDQSIAWVQAKLKELRPNAVIWPNQKMQDDCDIGLKGLVLRHHHRPNIGINPVRPAVKVIGYEGASGYLDGWRSAIDAECQKRRWRFVENPTELANMDIVLALRGGKWDSYAARHYKSNVKLANAHGSGTPFVGHAENGYTETASGAEYWVAEPGGLGMCFDWLESKSAREQVSDRFRQRAYTVEQAAKDLRNFLEQM